MKQDKKQKATWQMTAKELNNKIGETLESKRSSGIDPWMITKDQMFAYLQLRERIEYGTEGRPQHLGGPFARCMSDDIHR